MAGILLLPLWVCAQGVNFRPLSYTEAIELAAKENKMVLLTLFLQLSRRNGIISRFYLSIK